MLILKLNNNKNNINNIERTQATATAAASERNKIYNKTMNRYKIMYKNILEKHKINEKYITHDTSKREGEKELKRCECCQFSVFDLEIFFQKGANLERFML